MDRIDYLIKKATDISSQQDLGLMLTHFKPLVEHNKTARSLLKIIFHKVSKFINKSGTDLQKDIIIDMRPYFEGPVSNYDPTQVVYLINSLEENAPSYCTNCEQYVDQESCPQCHEGTSFLWDE